MTLNSVPDAEHGASNAAVQQQHEKPAHQDEKLKQPVISRFDIAESLDGIVSNIRSMVLAMHERSFDPRVYAMSKAVLSAIETRLDDLSYLSFLISDAELEANPPRRCSFPNAITLPNDAVHTNTDQQLQLQQQELKSNALHHECNSNDDVPLFNPICFDICGFFESIMEPFGYVAEEKQISFHIWHEIDVSNMDSALFCYNDPDHIRRAISVLLERLIEEIPVGAQMRAILLISRESPANETIARISIALVSPIAVISESIIRCDPTSTLGISMAELNADMELLYPRNIFTNNRPLSTLRSDGVVGVLFKFKCPLIIDTKVGQYPSTLLDETKMLELLNIHELLASRHAMAGRKMLILSPTSDRFSDRISVVFGSIDCDVSTVCMDTPDFAANFNTLIAENSVSQLLLSSEFKQTFSVIMVIEDKSKFDAILSYRISNNIIGPLIFVATPSACSTVLEDLRTHDPTGMISSYVHLASLPVGPRKMFLTLKVAIDQEMSDISASSPTPVDEQIPRALSLRQSWTGAGRGYAALSDGASLSGFSMGSSFVDGMLSPAIDGMTLDSNSDFTTRTSKAGTVSRSATKVTDSDRADSSSQLSRSPSPIEDISVPSFSSQGDENQTSISTRLADDNLNPTKKRSSVGLVPPIKVLIAEDNFINQKVIENFVKKNLGINPVCVSNGKQAVEKFMESRFHLVLMDISMPVMDGLEATSRIREYEAQQRGVGTSNTAKSIIVALTASSLPADRDMAFAAGCNDFLIKPVAFDWLERKIIEWGSMQALIGL